MNKTNLIHARTCVYNVHYHLVWSTKYRRKVLTDEVEAFLKDVFTAVAADKGFTIDTMEVMPDHVHLFVSAHPQVAPSYMVKMLKGISGRKILMQFSDIKKKLWKGHLWNSSFYLETVGSVSEDAIRKYIESQKGKE